LAAAAWSSSVGLCASGHYELAARLADSAAAALLRSCRDDPTPTMMGTVGALQLEAAAAHGLAGREGDAYRYLDAAATTASRMPSGAWHLPSAFDKTNVEILAVIIGVSLHRPGEAIARAPPTRGDQGLARLDEPLRVLDGIGEFRAGKYTLEPAGQLGLGDSQLGRGRRRVRFRPADDAV
jgi:hypothetical protein